MKRYTSFLIISVLAFTACTGSHYFRKNNDTLSIFLRVPDARQVYFLSSLDAYRPREAMRVDERTWQISVPAQIEFKYFYKVDGKVYLPNCWLKEKDDFGSQNCIYLPEL